MVGVALIASERRRDIVRWKPERGWLRGLLLTTHWSSELMSTCNGPKNVHNRHTHSLLLWDMCGLNTICQRDRGVKVNLSSAVGPTSEGSDVGRVERRDGDSDPRDTTAGPVAQLEERRGEERGSASD